MEHSVNAVPDAKGFGQRLQVNIRSAHFERFGDHRVDQLDQRRVGFDGAAVRKRLGGDLDVFLRQLLDGFQHARVGGAAAPATAALGVILAQGILNVGVGSDLQADIHLQEVLQAVDGIQVRRIRYGHRQTAVVLENGNDAIFARDVAGNGGDDFVGDLDLVEINH